MKSLLLDIIQIGVMDHLIQLLPLQVCQELMIQIYYYSVLLLQLTMLILFGEDQVTLMVIQLKDISPTTTVQCIMVNNLKDLSVNNGNQQASVHLMDQNAQLTNLKEVGVHLKDLTQLLHKALKNNNHLVFQLEVGQIPLILHIPQLLLKLQVKILSTSLTELIILVINKLLHLLISTLNICLMLQPMEPQRKELQLMPLWLQQLDNNYLIWFSLIVPDLMLSQIIHKMALHFLQIKKVLLSLKPSLIQV